MPSPPIRRIRLSLCGQTAVAALLISAAIALPATLSRAEDTAGAANAPAAAASESASPGAGPLTPVHREPPAGTASTSRPMTARKPTITMPDPGSIPSEEGATLSPSAAAPQSTKAEEVTSPTATSKPAKPKPKQAAKAAPSEPRSNATIPAPKRAEQAAPPSAAPKVNTPTPKQAEEASPPRPHRKPPAKTTTVEQEKKATPVERRTTVVQRRERVYPDQPIERVYREEYDWAEDAPFSGRRVPPFGPPQVYAQEPQEVGPAPVAPPWYYSNRPLAWGPHPGMRFPPPMPW